MPQSIIVYRNPAEAAFWELFMGSEYTFPIVVSMVVFLCVLPLAQRLINRFWSKRGLEALVSQVWGSYAALVISAIFAVATFLWMV